MKKFLPVFLCLIVILFSGCASMIITKPMEPNISRDIEVRGFPLKYALFDIAKEIEQTQIANYFTEKDYQSFEKINPEIYQHYLWMKDTYSKMSSEMKIKLGNIYKTAIDWYLLNSATNLTDGADINDITKLIETIPGIPSEKRKDMLDFFPYFYNNFLKDYLAQKGPVLQQKADDINSKITKNDLLSFMQNTSGINFDKQFQVVFYFFMRPIGAYGFEYKNLKISTIQQTVNSNNLYDTPFHELTHSFFHKFDNSSEFKDASNNLLKISAFKSHYDEMKNSGYPGVNDTAAENLVEGFAKFLSYKYYGREISPMELTYLYDYDFYKYLKEIDFNPSKISLKEACINFMKKISN